MSISDYGLKNNNDFNGPVADLIKITNAYSRNGKEVKDVINVLRRPDKKQVLEEINNYQGKSETQKAMEEEPNRAQRASDFGIGEY